MWRFLHLVGWLIALGLAGWVVGIVMASVWDTAFDGRVHLVGPFVAASGGAGLVAGLLLSLATWSRGAWDRPLILVGSVLVVLGVVSGAFLFLAAAAEDRQRPDVPLAGFEQVMLGILAFCGAAVGVGLALAGIAGRLGRQPPTPIGSSH